MLRERTRSGERGEGGRVWRECAMEAQEASDGASKDRANSCTKSSYAFPLAPRWLQASPWGGRAPDADEG